MQNHTVFMYIYQANIKPLKALYDWVLRSLCDIFHFIQNIDMRHFPVPEPSKLVHSWILNQMDILNKGNKNFKLT